MKVIRKTICLDQFKSHMPSIVPAYDDNGVQHEFTHITDFETQPLVNYGMIPFDVKVDEGDNLKLGEYGGKLYTFQQLTTLFHELDSYYEGNEFNQLLDTDKNMYQWLTSRCFPYFLFDIELNNPREIKEYWGKNKLSIYEVSYWVSKMIDLKEKSTSSSDLYCCEKDDYEKRGGDTMLAQLKNWYDSKIKPILCHINDYGHDFIYEVNDSDTTVTVKVLKNDGGTKEITTHTFQIYEPRVKIFGNNRYIKYGEIQKSNGDYNVINPQNIEIIDGILTIPCLHSPKNAMLVISEPSITVPLMLSNTMTNMGEMTSICEMWDGGYDYRANINLDADEMDYSGGVLVHYNNDNWILTSYYGGPGYLYSEKYKEIYFANKSGMTSEEYLRFTDEDNEVAYAEQWERYLDYIPQIEKEILNNYAYKGNQLVLNPNPLVMSNKYEIYTNDGKGYCVKNSIICLIFTCEYIEVGKKNYEIFYVFEKVNPYITYDGERVYLTINNNEAIIKSKQICSKFTQKYTVRSGNCYYYGDTLYIKDESIFIDGYANINNNDIYFAYEGGVLKEKTFNGIYKIGEFCKDLSLKDETFLGYTTFKDNTTELSYVQYVTPYTKYNGKYVIGETSSRLDEFTDELNIASDNLGNRFDGLMPYKTITVGNKTYTTYVTNPAPNDWLSIKFRPQFTVDMDEDGDNYYGNIIEKVVFTWQESSAVTSAATTQSEMIKIEQYLHSGISTNKVSDISMTVTYYIGTLVQKNASGYTLFDNSGKTPYYGIKYTETFSLSPSQCLYHYDDVNSCILNYFRLEGNTKPYAMDRYNAVGSETNIATFEYVIKPFDLQYGFIDLSSGNNTFYRVNEFDETIELSGKTYPLEFEGSRKYFSFGVEKNASLYDGYLYYCIKDGVKFYATKIMSGSNTNYEFKFTPDDVYSTNGSNNNFTKDEEALTNQVYCLVPIKMYLVTSPGTFDPYFDYSNNTTISPLIFDENKLGFAMQEKIVENIYNIDRGTVRAMDFHLRLLESKSLESLEQIGNGFFKFNTQ